MCLYITVCVTKESLPYVRVCVTNVSILEGILITLFSEAWTGENAITFTSLVQDLVAIVFMNTIRYVVYMFLSKRRIHPHHIVI